MEKCIYCGKSQDDLQRHIDNDEPCKQKFYELKDNLFHRSVCRLDGLTGMAGFLITPRFGLFGERSSENPGLWNIRTAESREPVSAEVMLKALFTESDLVCCFLSGSGFNHEDIGPLLPMVNYSEGLILFDVYFTQILMQGYIGGHDAFKMEFDEFRRLVIGSMEFKLKLNVASGKSVEKLRNVVSDFINDRCISFSEQNF